MSVYKAGSFFFVCLQCYIWGPILSRKYFSWTVLSISQDVYSCLLPLASVAEKSETQIIKVFYYNLFPDSIRLTCFTLFTCRAHLHSCFFWDDYLRMQSRPLPLGNVAKVYYCSLKKNLQVQVTLWFLQCLLLTKLKNAQFNVEEAFSNGPTQEETRVVPKQQMPRHCE